MPGQEDHFCGNLLGLPMGVDVCHANQAKANQNDGDVLLELLCVTGLTFVEGVPTFDDIVLG